ncbi:MAG TPA: hypothetical protein VL176_05440 [Steroidobacteraceae bacterium]|nr:hypothetical protein [Steroidobacteraceae bacterium]
MKIFGPDNQELIAISAIERDGAELVLRGKILGTLPMSARIRPEEARRGLRMLDWRTALFVLSLPWRRAR